MKSLQEMEKMERKKEMEMQTRNGQEALQSGRLNGQMEQRNGNRFDPKFVPPNLHAALRAEGFTASQYPQRPVTYRGKLICENEKAFDFFVRSMIFGLKFHLSSMLNIDTISTIHYILYLISYLQNNIFVKNNG